MNIQYNHRRRYCGSLFGTCIDSDFMSPKGGETVALEIPPAWFLETLEVGAFFEKKVGKARCSNEDNYNKKTGRDLATSRMKTTRLTCIGNTQFADARLVVLQDSNGDLYTLKLSNNQTQPHFIDYE